MLTDDKTYPYIALTNETHPRLIVTRNKRRKKEARYFGPYPNVLAARNTINLLNQIYPLRKCYNIPNKECLYYHLNQWWCSGNSTVYWRRRLEPGQVLSVNVPGKTKTRDQVKLSIHRLEKKKEDWNKKKE